MTQSKHPKFRIYQGIVCLESNSRHGAKWWDQGFKLGYTPYPISKIQQAKFGRLEGIARDVLAIRVNIGRGPELIAINLPRSDIPTLQARGLWPAKLALPYTEIKEYAEWPERI